MEEVKKTYKEKKEEMMQKYDYAIKALSVANDVDMGVAFDMLKTNARVPQNYAYVNQAELEKDYNELLELAKNSAESAEEETKSAENTAE